MMDHDELKERFSEPFEHPDHAIDALCFVVGCLIFGAYELWRVFA